MGALAYQQYDAGLSDAKVEKLQEAAFKLIPMGFTTAALVAEQRGEMIQISSGCEELDSILEGAHPGSAAGSLCLHCVLVGNSI